jgi:serine/threonine protein kinase
MKKIINCYFKGNFGVVHKATYEMFPENIVQVACKQLQPGVSGLKEFLKEGLIMEKLKHQHIVKLIGISFTQHFAPILVTEFMENNDLHKYLRDSVNVCVFGISSTVNKKLNV